MACRTRRGRPQVLPGGEGALLLPDLPRDREVVPPVAQPAVLRRLLAQRDLLAVGDGLQPLRSHPERDQVVVSGLGPPLAQGQVVLDGASLVGVAFDRHAQEVEALEGVRVLGKEGAVGLADVGACLADATTEDI